MLFTRCATTTVVSLLLATSGFAAEGASNTSGSVTVNGKATALHHAYAFHDAHEKSTRVLITDRALEATMLAAEASGTHSGDAASFRELSKAGKATGIELIIDASNRVATVVVFHQVFGTPTPTSGPQFWYEPYRAAGADWLGGRSRSREPQKFFELVWEYDVEFLTSVGQQGFDIPTAAALAAAHKANDAREAARRLPAGGGAEGAAYLAFHRNAEAKNWPALLGQMTASMNSAIATEEHASTPLSESTLESWAFMTLPAGKVDVVGGTRDPDGTTIELRSTPTTGRKTFGTARLVNEAGGWKVAAETWR